MVLARGLILMLLAAGCTTAMPQSLDEETLARQRERMVAEQLRARDIRSRPVLEAMGRVPRHLFIPAEGRASAYADHALPIGFGQTISQPYIVAFMTEALEVTREHRVLEIGTGSGYQAAVLAELAGEVFSIEIVEPLATRAKGVLEELGYTNVRVRAGNGYAGWPEEAPFDRIIVTAAPEAIPPALVDQLKPDGLLAIPVGVGEQTLRIMRKTRSGMSLLRTLPVRFVPMTGKPN
ncbi:protein-L-isoaspartate(D-aspartate) O-methyltransferase [soil metagenome]